MKPLNNSHQDRLLKYYRSKNILYNLLNIARKRELDFEKSKKYFAHLRAVKCCTNNKDKSEASQILHSNCIKNKYLRKELTILKPHIIVTQGNRAAESIKSLFKPKKVIDIYRYFNEENQGETIYTYFTILLSQHHKTLVFPLTHPTARNKDRSIELDRFVFMNRMMRERLFLR